MSIPENAHVIILESTQYFMSVVGILVIIEV